MVGNAVVLDVGKTLAKLSLWSSEGSLLARETRANARVETDSYVALDVQGIESWLEQTLAKFARQDRIGAIVPVGHGAASVVVRNGQMVCPPIDYEEPIPEAIRAEYAGLRDSFQHTGSPRLPDGLNLGAQLHYLESRCANLTEPGSTILLWPQYWAWRLSGVAASEVTSLGCHSDLWNPVAGMPSDLAKARGWAGRLPPIAAAGSQLGPITADWASRTNLPADTKIYCGLHDSNAALLAARCFEEIGDHEATVVSTGTWFIAMRSPKDNSALDLGSLAEERDCLLNVDAYGKVIPSARFMGGREIETLTGLDTRRVDIKPDQPDLIAAVPAVLNAGAMVLPTFAPGFGPFPNHRGRWIRMPADQAERRTAVCLYAALVADASLSLVGARERILIEGRFAEAEVFVRALASLRPDDVIYTSHAHNDVAYGALRLINPGLSPLSTLNRVQPLPLDLAAYRDEWRRDVARGECAG